MHPKPVFSFITTNEEKLESAHRHLDPLHVLFTSQALHLTEIQSDDIHEIARLKAQEAFQTVHASLVVSDHTWNIPALNGFPGPYMKYINQWFLTEDMMQLMRSHQDKTIIKTEILGYQDEFGYKSFEWSAQGTFLDAPRGDGLPVMRIVSLLPSGMSVAQCITQRVDQSKDYTIWETFIAWYLENRKLSS